MGKMYEWTFLCQNQDQTSNILLTGDHMAVWEIQSVSQCAVPELWEIRTPKLCNPRVSSGPHIECMITTTKLPVHNGYHAKLWSTVHMSSKSKITTRICQHIFMLRSIQLMNTWLRVHERWNSVPLTSWPQAVNSSRVHATQSSPLRD